MLISDGCDEVPRSRIKMLAAPSSPINFVLFLVEATPHPLHRTLSMRRAELWRRRNQWLATATDAFGSIVAAWSGEEEGKGVWRTGQAPPVPLSDLY